MILEIPCFKQNAFYIQRHVMFIATILLSYVVDITMFEFVLIERYKYEEDKIVTHISISSVLTIVFTHQYKCENIYNVQ